MTASLNSGTDWRVLISMKRMSTSSPLAARLTAILSIPLIPTLPSRTWKPPRAEFRVDERLTEIAELLRDSIIGLLEGGVGDDHSIPISCGTIYKGDDEVPKPKRPISARLMWRFMVFFQLLKGRSQVLNR